MNTRRLPARLAEYTPANYATRPGTVAYEQHRRAVMAPNTDELTIRLLADSIHRLAAKTEGQDGVADPIIRDLLESFISILDVVRGGWDAGTLDTWAREVADYIGEPLD